MVASIGWQVPTLETGKWQYQRLTSVGIIFCQNSTSNTCKCQHNALASVNIMNWQVSTLWTGKCQHYELASVNIMLWQQNLLATLINSQQTPKEVTWRSKCLKLCLGLTLFIKPNCEYLYQYTARKRVELPFVRFLGFPWKRPLIVDWWTFDRRKVKFHASTQRQTLHTFDCQTKIITKKTSEYICIFYYQSHCIVLYSETWTTHLISSILWKEISEQLYFQP